LNLTVVILAAGQGTRMRSDLPKVMHPVAGRAMVGYVLDAAQGLGPRDIAVVVGHGADLVRQALGDGVSYATGSATQPRQHNWAPGTLCGRQSR